MLLPRRLTTGSPGLQVCTSSTPTAGSLSIAPSRYAQCIGHQVAGTRVCHGPRPHMRQHLTRARPPYSAVDNTASGAAVQPRASPEDASTDAGKPWTSAAAGSQAREKPGASKRKARKASSAWSRPPTQAPAQGSSALVTAAVQLEVSSMILRVDNIGDLYGLVFTFGHAFNHVCTAAAFSRLAKLVGIADLKSNGSPVDNPSNQRFVTAPYRQAQERQQHRAATQHTQNTLPWLSSHSSSSSTRPGSPASQHKHSKPGNQAGSRNSALFPSDGRVLPVDWSRVPDISSLTFTEACLQTLLLLYSPLLLWLPHMEIRQLCNILSSCAKLRDVHGLSRPLQQVCQLVVEQVHIRGVQAEAVQAGTCAVPQYAVDLTQGVYAQSDATSSPPCLPVTGAAHEILKMHQGRWSSDLLYGILLLDSTPHQDTAPQYKAVFEWACQHFMQHSINPRDLSNVAYAIALTDKPQPVLWDFICRKATRLLEQYQHQGQQQQQLAVLGDAARQQRTHVHEHEWSAKSLAYLSWAVSQLGCEQPGLVRALHLHLASTASSFKAVQDAGYHMWAAGSLAAPNINGWYQQRAQPLCELMPFMGPRWLALVLLAYARANVRQQQVVDTAVGVLLEFRPYQFSRLPRAVAQTVWSLARLGCTNQQVFYVLQRAALDCALKLSGEQLIMLLWGLAKYYTLASSEEQVLQQQLLDPKVITNILTGLQPHIRHMSAKQVVSLATSLSMLRWHAPEVHEPLLKRAADLRDDLSLQQLSTLMWFVSKVLGPGHRQSSADQLLDQALMLVDNLTGKRDGSHVGSTASLMWSCSVLHPGNVSVMRSCMEALAPNVDQLETQQLSMVAQGLIALSQLGGVTPSQLNWMAEPSIRALAVKSMTTLKQVTSASQPSAIQLQVFAELENVPGVQARQLEVLVVEGLYCIDILVRYRSEDVAIEVDGPFHYMLNRPGLVTGDTQLRRRMLASYGFRLLSIRANEFSSWGTIQFRIRQLGQLLNLAVHDPKALVAVERVQGDALGMVQPDATLHLDLPQHRQPGNRVWRAVKPAQEALGSGYSRQWMAQGSAAVRDHPAARTVAGGGVSTGLPLAGTQQQAGVDDLGAGPSQDQKATAEAAKAALFAMYWRRKCIEKAGVRRLKAQRLGCRRTVAAQSHRLDQ